MHIKASDYMALAIVGLFLVGAAGWVINIIKLVAADSYGFFEVIRAIGVLAAPLGALLGFF